MPTRLYTIENIRCIEEASKQFYSSLDLMQRAGSAAFDRLMACWPKAKRIVVFTGKGNNGGDGYVLATQAKKHGLDVSVRHVGSLNNLPDPAWQVMQACASTGTNIQPYSSTELYDTADVMVDALLGIGLNHDVQEEYAQAIQSINNAKKPVLALDMPSGIQADTGRVCKVAVKADQTITFIGIKRGLVTGQAPAYCGELVCNSLGLPETVFQIPTTAEILAFKTQDLPARSKDAHKGDFGHVLVIGGNYGMGGAARLAAEAAARIGAGLVTVATRPEHVSAILAARPELMCYGITSSANVEPLINRATVILLGPGLGQDDWAQHLYACALASKLPKVIDADALNLLAKEPSYQQQSVITPHPGEAARLLQCKTADTQFDRFAAAKQLQQRYGGITVLKGVGSIVQAENKSYLCTAGNPGMASGGMGDVLGGVIAGLLAQKLSLLNAAKLGVMIHALAADQAALLQGERGLLASDVLSMLPKLANDHRAILQAAYSAAINSL